MTVREVLHAHVPTLSASSTVRDAVDKMDIYQFPALVIVDENQAPIAVITEGDLARGVTNLDGLTKMAQEPAIHFGSKSPTVTSVDAEVSDALHSMLSRGLTILPVVEDQRFMGVVLRVDLMQAILAD